MWSLVDSLDSGHLPGLVLQKLGLGSLHLPALILHLSLPGSFPWPAETLCPKMPTAPVILVSDVPAALHTIFLLEVGC